MASSPHGKDSGPSAPLLPLPPSPPPPGVTMRDRMLGQRDLGEETNIQDDENRLWGGRIKDLW